MPFICDFHSTSEFIYLVHQIFEWRSGYRLFEGYVNECCLFVRLVVWLVGWLFGWLVVCSSQLYLNGSLVRRNVDCPWVNSAGNVVSEDKQPTGKQKKMVLQLITSSIDIRLSHILNENLDN